MKQRKKYAAEDSLSTEVSVLILRLLGVSNEWRLGREINFIFTTSLDPRRSVGNVLESVQTSSRSRREFAYDRLPVNLLAKSCP
jgi:hypothetical protein